jgi:achaete-scute complex protein
MEQNHITKDDDPNEQQLEYTFLTPVSTIAEEELLIQEENNYHFCYNNQMVSSPRSDVENFDGSESNGSSQAEQFDKKSDPFSPQCKIPIPGLCGNSHFFDSTTFIRRRNERERARVRNVNDGFERLRQHLPLNSNQRDKRLSKVETLRFAITYIHHLQSLLSHNSKSTNK